MKRKFKLFATLASLCLSVALMAFGVYAATHVTYNVTSTVSFASQVAGQFSWLIDGGSMADETGRSGSENALNGTEVHNTGSGAESLYALTRNLGEVVFHPETEELVITYYIYFENMSTDTDAVVSTSIANLYGLPTANNQLSIKVVQDKAGTKAAAKSAVDGVLALESGETGYVAPASSIPTLASVTLDKTTANDAEVFYVVAVQVTLVNATTKLVADTNDTLNLTLSVEPAQA